MPPPMMGRDAGTMPPAQSLGDPIQYASHAVDTFGGFFEPVEIQVWGTKVALCTGVRGLVIYEASDPTFVQVENAWRSDASSRAYPRCQHFAIDGDRAFVTNRGDEIQPEPFISVMDISDPSSARTLDTYYGDGSISFEGIAVRGDVLYAAMHDKGLGVFAIGANGALSLAATITDGVVNAWQPHVNGDTLYLADAGGGVALYSLANSMAPALLGKLPTSGTVKELAFSAGYAYGASGVAGVEVFDVRDPSAASLVTRIDTPGSALGVAVDAGHLLVADWNYAHLFRLTDPAAPTYVGHQKAYTSSGTPNDSGRILDATIRGNMVFLAEWENLQAHFIVPERDAPDLLVEGIVELPRTAPGASASTSIVVKNVGARPLTITGVRVEPPLTAEIPTMAIAPREQALLSIRFDPVTTGASSSTVLIASNDPDEAERRIAVRGNLQGLRVGDEVPNLEFRDLRGTTVDLLSQRGSPVLLAYFATF